MREPYEYRKDNPDNLVKPYIGIMPIISVKKQKDTISTKDIYLQFRKNYLSDLTLLLEAYFPPLKVIMLDPMQVTKYDIQTYQNVNKEFSTMINTKNLINTKVRKIIGRINVFDVAKAVRQRFDSNCCTVIALTVEPIYDYKPKGDSFILGRACGRVCIASMDNTTRQESLNTIVHEAMHTFSLDHCEKWNCIMNWLSLEQHCSYLCIADLLKMQHLFGYDIRERYLALMKLYKNKLGWIKDYQWTQKAVKRLTE